jgi:hypothetical protein
MSNEFLRIEGENLGLTLNWPNPTDPLDAIWAAYCAPSTITKEQGIWLSAAADAYKALIYLPTATSHRLIMQIRKALKDAS